MKAWMTAAEIAAAELPGLPTDKSSILRLGAREGWNDNPALARMRQGRGGGYEYNIRILPTLAQVAYMQRHLHVGAIEEPAAPGAEAPAALSGRAARERDARLAVVAAFESFSRGLPRLRQASRLQVFTDKYNFGSLVVEGWVKEILPRLTKRSLQRWMAAQKAGRVDRLAVDRGQARKGTGVIDTAADGRLRTFVLALLAQNAHYSAAHVRTLCRAEFGDALVCGAKSVPMPPVRTFQHAIRALKAENAVALTKLTNPDRYRSTLAPAGVGALSYISAPNALWQIDASPVDALCTDGRHTVYACIDIATRRAVFLISRTPRAAAVALLLRKAILAWGVPVQVKTDNGSDFVAQDTRRLLRALDIELELSDAYSPQQKGHVERLIRTFQHDFATLLPGFVGHSVADRKAIESRKSFAARLGESEAETFGVSLAGQELQHLADRWAETVYEVRGHGGLKGRSPREVYQSAAFRPRMVAARALDMLLMPVAGKDGQRTVTRLGVRIDGRHYATPRILPGTEVFVRHDPADMGRVYAFAVDGGAYLGEGICAELAGINPATLQRAVRELQTEAIDEVTRPVRKIMRDLAKGPSAIERALRIAAEDAPNVVPLPKRAEQHSTAQIDAALAAMDEIAGGAPRVNLDATTEAEHRRLVARFRAEEEAEAERLHVEVAARQAEHEAERVAEIAAALPANVATLETPKARYRRAWEIEQALEAGRPVDALDALWLGQYQTSAEYRGQRVVHLDFGDSYLT